MKNKVQKDKVTEQESVATWQKKTDIHLRGLCDDHTDTFHVLPYLKQKTHCSNSAVCFSKSKILKIRAEVEYSCLTGEEIVKHA